MRFLDKASIRVLSSIYPSIYVLVKNHYFGCNYGFDGKIINHSFTDLIIESDNLELFKLYAIYDKNNIIDILAKQGAIKILEYAHENGCPWDETTCRYAAQYGHLDCLRYAHENGCTWDKFTCRLAAECGHLNCLSYAYENGCPWDKNTCLLATNYGHLDCLRYAHENGCSWDVNTCQNAARSGHLDCLRYAHENGCPWDETTCRYAAQYGHLDCLRYAHENGCLGIKLRACMQPTMDVWIVCDLRMRMVVLWDVNTCQNAARFWTFGLFTLCTREMVVLGIKIRVDMQLNMDVWIVYAMHTENGCPWDETTCRDATIFGNLNCLSYAYENGCPLE